MSTARDELRNWMIQEHGIGVMSATEIADKAAEIYARHFDAEVEGAMPTVVGRPCYITNAQDGDTPEWVITCRPFGDGGDFLRKDGKWVQDIGVGEDSLFEWPTRAAAEQFISAHADQPTANHKP